VLLVVAQVQVVLHVLQVNIIIAILVYFSVAFALEIAVLAQVLQHAIYAIKVLLGQALLAYLAHFHALNVLILILPFVQGAPKLNN
jgi:hypothetical protein